MVIYMEVKKKIKKAMFFQRMKRNLEKVKKFYIKYKHIIMMCLPFVLMDVFTFLFGKDIDFVTIAFYAPVLFSTIWIALFVGLSTSFKGVINKILYLLFNALFLTMFLVNNVYYSMTKTFFDFSLVESASEGKSYMLDTLKNCNPWVYVSIIIVIIAIVYGYKYIPKNKKNNYKNAGIILTGFIVLHLIVPFSLGKANSTLTWSSWKNPRNIYISFNDNNKSMKICGLYEYTIRNFYITFLKTKEKENAEDVAFLDEAFKESEEHKNKYTGKFEGKNVIFLQMEGMDTWLVSKENTPTIYKLMNSSYNFTNHYSYYNGGGSTFNSEFAVNTGFITPLSYTKNAYTFNKNNFPYSMAHLFKKLDYSVNAFHMNTGEFYSRTVNYKNWGYDNYYGLADMFDYKNNEHQLDRELILNEEFSDLMFPEEGKFVDYIITYSPHLPFTNTKGVCKKLYEEDIQKEKEEIANSTGQSIDEIKIEFSQMSDEECAKRQAKETDYMVELLLQKMEEKGVLDNTVIIAFTDHYLYTIEDQSVLDKYKNTSNNLINNTPFFIWSSDTKKTNIKKVTSQLNILPTVLNLFGIKHNVNNYIGEDALNPNYEGIVFFSDYSWYDGNVYVSGAEVTNNKKIDPEELEDKNYLISYLTKKNDLALKFNYFKKVKLEKNNSKNDNEKETQN